jgi:hypothetical protein
MAWFKMARFRVTLWGLQGTANSGGSPLFARSFGANPRRRECYPGLNQAEKMKENWCKGFGQAVERAATQAGSASAGSSSQCLPPGRGELTPAGRIRGAIEDALEERLDATPNRQAGDGI